MDCAGKKNTATLMNKNVLHFVRKSTQLKATFIHDQITNHVNYKPFIVVKKKIDKKYDGGYADFDYTNFNILYLNNESDFSYEYLKKISKREVFKILDFIKENDIGILHFHYGTDAGLYYEVMKRSDIPVVISFYGYDISSFPKMYFSLGKKYLKYRVFKYADRILAMSEDMKNDLIKLGLNSEKIIVHYFGINGKIYDYKERKYLEKEKYTLLNVSSFVPHKGHMFLLRSINELIKRNIKNFELKLIGTGVLEYDLKNYVENEGLSNFVKFINPIKAHSEEFVSNYKNADVFVHPSVVTGNKEKEGIPGSIVEAMFNGLPVVSTYHAGIPHIIKDGSNGLLVKEWDIDKLVSSIDILLKDSELRKQIGKNARKYAMENLNLSFKEIELENIYDSIIFKKS